LLFIASCFAASSAFKFPPKQPSLSLDPCNQWPNCTECISNKFCGWCSSKVIYQNGAPGYQCAGFDPNNSSNPFVCMGTYSTDKCLIGYNCSADQCVETALGDGIPLDICNATCNPKYYTCSPTNVSCVETPADKGGIPLNVCQAQCKAANNTPSEVVGNWRGLEISGGFIRGEWKLEVGTSNATLFYPNGEEVWQGSVSTVETYIVINITSGADAGLNIYVLFQTQLGPVTKWATFAASRPGGNPPLSFDDAMTSPSSHEFVFISCIDPLICDFDTTATMTTYTESIYPSKPDAEDAADPPPDRCSPFPNCSSCLDEPYCGWCSTNVIYQGNIIGRNCAGFNPNGTDVPFVCVGSYSTQKCPVPPPAYACNSNTSQCTIAQSGAPESVCNATCGKNHTDILYQCNVATLTCEPNNGGQDQDTCNSTCKPMPIPALLTGVWRGLQVNQNYTKGEWSLIITSNGTYTSDFTFTSPTNITLSGQLEHVASEAVLIVTITSPVAGKRYSLYELAYGPETAYLTLANGPADATTYPSFIEAMTGQGMSELTFVSCLNPTLCKF